MRRLYTILEERTPQPIKALIPREWRIWLGRQIKTRPLSDTRLLDRLTHDLHTPTGYTADSIFAYLARFRLEGSEQQTDELRGYLQEAYRRFLYTLQIIPEGEGRLLEIGANPYYMSLLLKKFTSYDLEHTNFFGPDVGDYASQTMIGSEDQHRFDFHNVNVERDSLPFSDDAFDVVLLCEVLEHFTNDPMCALLDIKRVLKPNGHLILTTPNVARLENVARMIAGHNIYDPYSGYGPPGRHNREYNRHEIHQFVSHVGFHVEEMFTSDVHENGAAAYCDPDTLVHVVDRRTGDLGQYIFVRARNSQPATPGKPRWLYRSYPASELADQ